MMSLTFGLFIQVSGSGPLGPLVLSMPKQLTGIPVQKITLSHAHKCVISDFIRHKLIFSVVTSSPPPTANIVNQDISSLRVANTSYECKSVAYTAVCLHEG